MSEWKHHRQAFLKTCLQTLTVSCPVLTVSSSVAIAVPTSLSILVQFSTVSTRQTLPGFLMSPIATWGDLNEIDVNGGIRISCGFDYEHNYFVDECPATISGYVKDDSTAPLFAAIRLLQDGVLRRTTVSGADGTYLFDYVVRGSHIVAQGGEPNFLR